MSRCRRSARRWQSSEMHLAEPLLSPLLSKGQSTLGAETFKLVRSGGQGRGRTADLPLFRRTLVPTELPDQDRRSRSLNRATPLTGAVLTGFEPATSTLTGWRALLAALQDQAVPLLTYQTAHRILCAMRVWC